MIFTRGLSLQEQVPNRNSAVQAKVGSTHMLKVGPTHMLKVEPLIPHSEKVDKRMQT